MLGKTCSSLFQFSPHVTTVLVFTIHKQVYNLRYKAHRVFGSQLYTEKSIQLWPKYEFIVTKLQALIYIPHQSYAVVLTYNSTILWYSLGSMREKKRSSVYQATPSEGFRGLLLYVLNKLHFHLFQKILNDIIWIDIFSKYIYITRALNKQN